MKDVKAIMLVDDNPDDNFFHKRTILKTLSDVTVIIKEDGVSALEYLKANESPVPDLILLDINMPIMSGWEFLEEYRALPQTVKKQVIVVMLTSSENSEDIQRSKEQGTVLDFKTKPLTPEILNGILSNYF